MSYWVCCNSCFHPPSATHKLAVTTCGHIVCSVCYQKGIQGRCLICNAQCQVSPLSEKSSSEVKALFTDINDVANKQLAEIGKVIVFQARHQKRLLSHYQQRNEKLEELVVKVKQEMQQMAKKLNEQNAYIAKLESSLQHHSAKISSKSHMIHTPHTPHRPNPVVQIPYNSPMPLSRHSSSTNVGDPMEVDEKSHFKKSVPRLSIISPPQDGRIGTVATERRVIATANLSACSTTLSHFQGAPPSPAVPYDPSSRWKSSIFKPPSTFRHSSVHPPP
ncbi:probable E3 SUMO-protein ligase RNF212 isoform X2 [Thalassophryne amazonica]|uniref:probable E3 SUMO-protein ligase RNF212 isoform X2 n=1 Tax=Thalassophryne amazonica TaxID=390379 RepID=UPI0014719274|nr:probable E3 SUMO-protein ligase RNF212 isoform X2 [Thalassophryne amazonica]